MQELRGHDDLVNWRRATLEGKLHLEKKFTIGIVAAAQSDDADAVEQHGRRVEADNQIGETMWQIGHVAHAAQIVPAFLPVRRDPR